jgi:hypothetical protein
VRTGRSRRDRRDLTLAAAPDQVDLERDNRLVARIAMAQHSGDPAAENEVLRDADTTPDGLARLALIAAGVVSALLPVLRTTAGRQLINKLAMQALRDENSQ